MNLAYQRLAKASSPLMGSLLVGFLDPAVEIYLQFVQPVINLLSERHAVELRELSKGFARLNSWISVEKEDGAGPIFEKDVQVYRPFGSR